MGLTFQTLARLLTGLALTAGMATVSAQKGPAWLTSPPPDTPQHWFAAGEGPSVDTARQMALRAVAARLRSSIAGSVENRIQEVDGKVSRQAAVAVSEDILKTEFSGVEIEATDKSSVGVAVLVKVDKVGFIRDTRGQLAVLSKPVAEVEAALPGQSTLEQFIALRRVAPQIEQSLTLSQLLIGAGSVADGSQGVARFGGLQQRNKQVASRMVFELRSQPADADVAAVVAAFLSEQGMRSATRKTPGANVLVIDTQVRQAELSGDKMMKMVVRLSVQDEQGRDVANREHAASGSSRFDFQGARQTAVKNLAAAMRKAGPMAALGFAE